MIPNQWYAILESNEVRRGKPVGVTRLGERLVLWRDSHGKVACMRDLCPHRGVALSAGQILGDHIECPFHGFQYDVTGRCCLIPANGMSAPAPKAFQVYTYPTHEEHDFIWVYWGAPRDDLPPVQFFDTIDDSFSFSTIRDHWTVHYSRAIENQLDAVHLPFVHKTTIGRGGRTLVNGPLTRWASPDLMEIWVSNEVDQGQQPLAPGELPEPDRHPQLQFRLPNIWHNWISDEVRIMAAFAPIDDENTMMYVRFYQRFMRVPILREVVNALAGPMNSVILRQDKRVVITQRPKRSDLKMGEKLIQGDGPIIEYRKRRRELIDAAG